MNTQAPAITFVKTSYGPRPADAISEAEYEKLPMGARVVLKPTKSRSIIQLGLYWSVLQEVVDATGKWATKEHLHDALLLDLGYRTVILRLDGKKYWVRDSAAFKAMAQAQFNEYTAKAYPRLSEVVGYDVLAHYEENFTGAASPRAPADGGVEPPYTPPSTYREKAGQ